MTAYSALPSQDRHGRRWDETGENYEDGQRCACGGRRRFSRVDQGGDVEDIHECPHGFEHASEFGVGEGGCPTCIARGRW